MSHLIFLWLLLSLSEALKEASEYFLLTEFLKQGRSVEATPKHLIIVDGAILQPIPEHPKRDFIFCLSTAFGDAYLFQAPCQVELDNWVNSIHSACAAAFARHRGKTGTLHLLQVRLSPVTPASEIIPHRHQDGILMGYFILHLTLLQKSSFTPTVYCKI